MISSSRPDSALLLTRPTCGVPSARWPRTLGSELRNGHHESCGIVLSRCCRAGIPIEDIAHLVGHANTRTTEKVYRKELRPVLRRGAKAMDDLFKAHHEASEPPTLPPASSETKQSAEMTLLRLTPDQRRRL
jgi:hypothetical protein